MSQRTLTVMYCDADDPEHEAGESVTLGLDGTMVELDLCDEHLRLLHEAVDGWLQQGRVVSQRKQPRRSGGSRGEVSAAKDERAKIRAWAEENGIEVGERGRIPNTVLDGYAQSLLAAAPKKARRNGTRKTAGV